MIIYHVRSWFKMSQQQVEELKQDVVEMRGQIRSAWQIIERQEKRLDDQKTRFDAQAQQIKQLQDQEKEARDQLKESQRKVENFKRQSDEERKLRVQSIQALKKQGEQLQREPGLDAETQTEPVALDAD